MNTGPPALISRIRSLTAVVRSIARLRRVRPQPTIVLANGIFDLFHVGHLRYLQAARTLGNYLVVAVNDDRSARRLRGPGRPLVSARDRAEIVAAVRGVDAVVLFGAGTVAGVLRRLHPDIHCKGTDYTTATIPEGDMVRAYGGKVRIAGDRKRHASTDILRKMTVQRRRRASDASHR